MNEGINLLDPNKKSAPAALIHQLNTMRFVVASILFIVSVFSVVLFILVAISPLPALQKQEQSLRLTLSQSKSDMVKFALVDERTTAIKSVLANRQSFDQTIGLIQSKLPSDTQITAIQAAKNTVTVTVQSQSLQSLNNFLNGLIRFVQDKKAFSQVNLTELTNDNANNAYSVTVRLVLL